MEISVGDYVRTDKGNIIKIDKEKKNFQILKFFDVEYGNIVKYSKNIIDLIEEGDYVNGHLVIDKYKDTDDYGKDFITIEVESDLMLHKSLLEKHIKSIVTKEQIKQIEYRIKE